MKRIYTLLLVALFVQLKAQVCLTPTTYTPGGMFIATTDLNNDNKLDIVSLNSTNISSFLGDGNGGFTLDTITGNPSLLGQIYTADFNKDGNMDIVMPRNSSNYSDVKVWLGNGTGSFRSPAYYTVGQAPSRIAINDFNGDTYPDMAV